MAKIKIINIPQSLTSLDPEANIALAWTTKTLDGEGSIRQTGSMKFRWHCDRTAGRVDHARDGGQNMF